ncbi:MAG: CAP domain-containing protein [Bacillota bacterium]|jgi:uncharacterized YkwD family protein
MQFWKKRLSVVFAVCLVFSLLSLPLLAFAQEPCFDGVKIVDCIKAGFQNAGFSAVAVKSTGAAAEKGRCVYYSSNYGSFKLAEKQGTGYNCPGNAVGDAGFSVAAAKNTGTPEEKGYSGCNSTSSGTVVKLTEKQAPGNGCTGGMPNNSAGSRFVNGTSTALASRGGTFECGKSSDNGTLTPGTFYKVIRYRISIPLSPSKPVPQPAPQPGPTPPPSVNPPDPASKLVPPPSAPPAQPNPAPPSGGVTYSADELKMLELVNKERAANGLKPLAMDPQLVKLARMKAQDMIDNRYFAHESPTYGSPFDMMRKYGVTYRAAGENLAGASTVDSAHTNLMNSPGHRANILSPNYTKVGIGVVNGGPYGKMFVQMFIG